MKEETRPTPEKDELTDEELEVASGGAGARPSRREGATQDPTGAPTGSLGSVELSSNG